MKELHLKMQAPPKAYYLPLIVAAQFGGTAPWFAGNAVTDAMQLGAHTAFLTSIIQLGFITGTLLFALLTLADRFPAPCVFFISCIGAAACNGAVALFPGSLESVATLRFFTGICLAGIYPVGMKIAADLFPAGLGKALGYLVGALVLGTALPHLLRSRVAPGDWQAVLWITSGLALAAGFFVWRLLPRTTAARGAKFEWGAAFRPFASSRFRAAAFGYFGHMWELYAFWTFVPAFVLHGAVAAGSVPAWSFAVIGAGALGCVAGGFVSKKKGSAAVAFASLLLSCICCLLAPMVLEAPFALLMGFLLLWGFFVVADSPQFSTLVAQAAPPAYRGTALTMVTSLGFAITIGSIQLLQALFSRNPQLVWVLAIGPLLGLWALLRGGNLQKAIAR